VDGGGRLRPERSGGRGREALFGRHRGGLRINRAHQSAQSYLDFSATSVGGICADLYIKIVRPIATRVTR